MPRGVISKSSSAAMIGALAGVEGLRLIHPAGTQRPIGEPGPDARNEAERQAMEPFALGLVGAAHLFAGSRHGPASSPPDTDPAATDAPATDHCGRGRDISCATLLEVGGRGEVGAGADRAL